LRGALRFPKGRGRIGPSPRRSRARNFPKTQSSSSQIMIAAAILTILILLLPGLTYVAPRAVTTCLHLRGARGPCQQLARTMECPDYDRFTLFAQRSPLSSCTKYSLFMKEFLLVTNDTQQGNGNTRGSSGGGTGCCTRGSCPSPL
jgi:hypothetical protein